MPLPDTVMDRLKAAIVATDTTSADGAPALRVQYVGTSTLATTIGSRPDNAKDILFDAFILTDAAIADGAPAFRARAI